MTDKGKIVFENGSDEFLPSGQNPSADYMHGYQKGHEDALKWRPPETLPKHNGAEAILWLTTDKGFADVSAHCYLKDGAWYWFDSDEKNKRPDLILGWQPWPEPPV